MSLKVYKKHSINGVGHYFWRIIFWIVFFCKKYWGIQNFCLEKSKTRRQIVLPVKQYSKYNNLTLNEHFFFITFFYGSNFLTDGIAEAERLPIIEKPILF